MVRKVWVEMSKVLGFASDWFRSNVRIIYLLGTAISLCSQLQSKGRSRSRLPTDGLELLEVRLKLILFMYFYNLISTQIVDDLIAAIR